MYGFSTAQHLRRSSVESVISLQRSGQPETHLASVIVNGAVAPSSGGGAVVAVPSNNKCIDCLTNMRLQQSMQGADSGTGASGAPDAEAQAASRVSG